MKKTKQDGVYFFWSASILLCMLIAVFVLAFTSCKKVQPSGNNNQINSELSPEVNSPLTESPNKNDEDPLAESETGHSETDNPNIQKTEARLDETEDMGQEYVDKFFFLGDSTTNGLAHYDIVPKKQVWTPKSGTLSLWLWSTATIYDRENGTEFPITDAVEENKPEYLLITLGVNGVAIMKEEDFIKEYTNLVLAVKEASPNTKIILNSIYPVSSEYSKGITNEMINAANIWIERIANSTGVKYLDSASVLKDSNGALKKNYHNGDHIHLSAEGFDRVINYLRTHGY